MLVKTAFLILVAAQPKDHRFDIITDNTDGSPKPTDETALATTTTDQSPYSSKVKLSFN